MSRSRPSSQRPKSSAILSEFSEVPAWRSIGAGWRPLFGSYHEMGFSFEWHEFTSLVSLDWARSFHPGSIELCINLEGTGTLSVEGSAPVELGARTLTFYYQGEPSLVATRAANVLHRFITIEFAPTFLETHFQGETENLHPLLRQVLRRESQSSAVAPHDRIPTPLLQLVESLRHCPVFKPAQEMWFRCKALEIASHLFFQPAGGELFCTRAQRAARDRVEKARGILREQLVEPPPLEELGRLVGCSPFYLSRQFSQETGMTIQQYVQQIRMERAAELLRTGQCNVTEAAFAVGYSSLSHFSTVFRETFGCCPGLYPLKTPTQKAAT